MNELEKLLDLLQEDYYVGVTSKDKEFWQYSPELNCYDRYFCSTGSKEFCQGINLTTQDYLYHEDKTICYHEIFVRHLFKVREQLGK